MKSLLLVHFCWIHEVAHWIHDIASLTWIIRLQAALFLLELLATLLWLLFQKVEPFRCYLWVSYLFDFDFAALVQAKVVELQLVVDWHYHPRSQKIMHSLCIIHKNNAQKQRLFVPFEFCIVIMNNLWPRVSAELVSVRREGAERIRSCF